MRQMHKIRPDMMAGGIPPLQFEIMMKRWHIDLPDVIKGNDRYLTGKEFSAAEVIDGFPSSAHVMDAVCAETGHTKVQMIGTAQDRALARARYLFVALARVVVGMNGPQIAHALNKDPSTIVSATRRADDLIQHDEKFRQTYLKLKGHFDE